MELEVISGLQAWRQQHPKATLREIESEVNVRLAAMRAKLLAELSGASGGGDWAAGEGPVCPECGREMVKRGKETRWLATGEGAGFEIERQYASCPACGVGFFPPR